ncbi:hypothetical protein D3C84_1231890 [compost metagenome]
MLAAAFTACRIGAVKAVEQPWKQYWINRLARIGDLQADLLPQHFDTQANLALRRGKAQGIVE